MPQNTLSKQMRENVWKLAIPNTDGAVNNMEALHLLY